MADISIKKLNESFIEIGAQEDITYNIYARYSEFVAGFAFNPKYKLRLWDRKTSFIQYAFRNPSNWVDKGSSFMV